MFKLSLTGICDNISGIVRFLAIALLSLSPALAQTAGPAVWQNDLKPIGAADWNYDFAAHLLERAGFGGTPDEIAALAKMTPAQAVARLVRYEGVANIQLPPFDEDQLHDAGLEPFPPSRPAVTDLAKAKGEALGIKVMPTGNRRLQPIVDKFFYWLRASSLETNRVAYWWANRMLTSPRPLQEKIAIAPGCQRSSPSRSLMRSMSARKDIRRSCPAERSLARGSIRSTRLVTRE